MVTFDSLLQTLYEIEGLSDPQQPLDIRSCKTRLDDIFELAGEQLRASGWHPDYK